MPCCSLVVGCWLRRAWVQSRDQLPHVHFQGPLAQARGAGAGLGHSPEAAETPRVPTCSFVPCRLSEPLCPTCPQFLCCGKRSPFRVLRSTDAQLCHGAGTHTQVSRGPPHLLLCVPLRGFHTPPPPRSSLPEPLRGLQGGALSSAPGQEQGTQPGYMTPAFSSPPPPDTPLPSSGPEQGEVPPLSQGQQGALGSV